MCIETAVYHGAELHLVMIEGHPDGVAAQNMRMGICSSRTLRKAPIRSNSRKSPT